MFKINTSSTFTVLENEPESYVDFMSFIDGLVKYKHFLRAGR